MKQHRSVLVWDLAVRIGHWSLVAAFIVAYASGEEDDLLHSYAGYVVLGIVLFRILWGLIGTRHARFADFIYGPRAVGAYLKALVHDHPKRYLGHNPAGGVMVLLLLVSLFATAWSGLLVYGAEGHGPLAGRGASPIASALADDDKKRGEDDEEEFWEDIHEFFADFTLLLVILHVGGVAVSSLLHRENLVKAMITGRKAVDEDEAS